MYLILYYLSLIYLLVIKLASLDFTSNTPTVQQLYFGSTVGLLSFLNCATYKVLKYACCDEILYETKNVE